MECGCLITRGDISLSEERSFGKGTLNAVVPVMTSSSFAFRSTTGVFAARDLFFAMGFHPRSTIETATWVARVRPFLLQLQSVVDLRQEGMTLLDELPALPVFAKSQILVGLDLRRGVGVVQFDEVECLDRIPAPRHPVGLPPGGPSPPEGW